MAGKFNAERYQKANSGTTLRKNPKVQDNRPAVNRQTWSILQNGYEASKRLHSSPSRLWNPQHNRQRTAVQKHPIPAKSPALYGREAAPQLGLGPRAWTSATARGTRVSRNRDSRRSGATRPSLKVAPVAQSFHDPNFEDPRYEPVVLLQIPNAYGGAIIIRARKEQTDTVPQRRDPPKRQWQRQRVWTQRTNS